MHPIEHLRFLARAGDADPGWLLPEAAWALGGLADDRNALVMGCRKLLEHHPVCGPMWWLCGRLLTAADPARAVDELVGTFDRDATALQLSLALSDVEGAADTPPRIIETPMAAPSGIVVVNGVRGAKPDGSAIWVAAGVGTVVADEIFTAATRDLPRGAALLSLDTIGRVVRPDRIGGVELLRTRPDAPYVSELLPRG